MKEEQDIEQKQFAMDIALKHAKMILNDAQISKYHKFYGLRLYEMQFAIYNQLKLGMDIID